MTRALGFIGLGVMGEPMCRNLAEKSGHEVVAFDPRAEPLRRLAGSVRAAASASEVGQAAEVVFLSVPGGPEVESVVGDLLQKARAGQIIVDTSTAPVALERALAEKVAATGAAYADAPIARTRAAAQEGTLSITVGAEPDVYAAIEPFLRCMGSDVLHCGPVGCGQVVKLMNNMVLFQTVVALAEAMAIARRAGVEERLLLEALSNGSADSFALRNHAMKAMLPRDFPPSVFPTDYAIKDVVYALDLANQTGVEARGALLVREILERSSAAGQGNAYFPALIRLLEGET